MIKAGDKVKYMGTRDPQYTNKVLEVDRVLEEGLILKFPLEDQREMALITWLMKKRLYKNPSFILD